jgi:hypothetical protein
VGLNILVQRYFDGSSLLRYPPLFKFTNDTHNLKNRMLKSNPRQARIEKKRRCSDLLCSWQNFSSSPTISFSLFRREVFLLLKTKTTSERALKSRAVLRG